MYDTLVEYISEIKKKCSLYNYLPPPSISTCRLSKLGNLSNRADMSVHRPIAHKSERVVSSPMGVISKQATSCSIVVVLN